MTSYLCPLSECGWQLRNNAAGISAATGIAVIADSKPVSDADGKIILRTLRYFWLLPAGATGFRGREIYSPRFDDEKTCDNVFPAAPPRMPGQFRIRQIADAFGDPTQRNSPALYIRFYLNNQHRLYNKGAEEERGGSSGRIRALCKFAYRFLPRIGTGPAISGGAAGNTLSRRFSRPSTAENIFAFESLLPAGRSNELAGK